MCDEIRTSRAHRHAPNVQPPCTHRSVHRVRRIDYFSTVRQQNWTWVDIECGFLRAQNDSVSTGGQIQRLDSPFNPSTARPETVQNRPETGVPAMILCSSKRVGNRNP